MSVLVFDNKNEKIFFSNYNLVCYSNSLEDFKQYNKNDILINIISNTKKISEEINDIIEDIKKTYKNTAQHISFNTSNLENISFLFSDLVYMARKYSEGKLESLQRQINIKNTLIKKDKEELEDYEKALKESTIIEEDKYDFILNIEDRFYNNFPKNILLIYNKIRDIDFVYKDKLEEERDYEIYNNYIFSQYNSEYKKYITDKVKDYPKTINIIKRRIEETNKEYKDSKRKYKTYYFEKFLFFLENIKNTILYLEYQIKALNCIDYDSDDIFNWSNITKEERLFLARIYSNPFNLGFRLPKSEIIYAIEEDKKITLLTDYACKLTISNKGKPYFNIIQDFLRKNIIELHQYECKDVIEIINVLLYQYKISNVQINKCLNCGKYFIPKKKSNEKYCDNLSPQNEKKTCKEFGVNKTYREEVKSLPIKREHNKISQAYRMRIKRAKNEEIKIKEENAFKKYKEMYQRKKQQYMKNKLSESEFVNWIIEQRS